MFQNIIVLLIIAAAVTNIIYKAAKLLLQKKDNKLACGGCSQCEIKKSLIQNGQRQTIR